ncbi:alpha/beta fold hydrolase [Promethearchaeum syntrophicum]|uniref:Alpha/beta fold hydrolase n=1 Tax=Promethearchaeum syntrophicum TaxID=2594042 RepID=A0A5B9D649_9ARCH|nr:alpha/beta hydrolase [Candidatus Prometheoarchaeum syntrophicum]QEE14512.1 short chain dehydrogenase [Candidatus Prometheoarchaeum syntrophicum]
MEKPAEISYKMISVGSIRLHVALAGNHFGKPIILLHGFPDAHFGWEQQIHALTASNFFVIAPDQRGYNLSDKPKGKSNYKMYLLVEDVIYLADALNIDKFYLAGHDFGAMVAWNLMEKYSARVNRLIIFNVPHPQILAQFLKNSKTQRKKSWYAFFFRIPLLPEILIRLTNMKMLSSAMKDSFSKDILNRYQIAWKQPGSLTAMLNWYRCMLKERNPKKNYSIIENPTMIVWGKKDPHLMWEMAPESAKMCQNAQVKFFENASHWVLEDEAEKTSELLVKFCKKE